MIARPDILFLNRIEEVAFSFNGGKDSTVCFHVFFFGNPSVIFYLIDSDNETGCIGFAAPTQGWLFFV
jgi:3'-phosphoadenosine 5'-phosphosulfate sulfotransferase (PAPS reductase)/FAD synthetase